ncbi:EAL domain-containing protein [Pseudomonas sp. R-28-1W-6]|uniref:putative bifunctional diguanylate cyclase/phosphodiesterase n=1 Tax=Pseudomonas sp. R-28-1W-6 TaxID=2650101 RepID=UPI0013651DC0|nr:EAL domain-containing protein [Pseudomonas sp. R-28-1W-6]MWV14066.1 EAL domain-containing protein [Pseudomonas sp. R-28-1W-6]
MDMRVSHEEAEFGLGELASAVFDTAVDSMVVIDAHGRVRELNPAAVRTFGYAREELLGLNINVLMPEPYHSQHDSYLANYQHSGRPRIIGKGREVMGRRKDGSCFPLHLSVGELQLAGQRLFVGICHDISERRALHERLTQLATYDALTGCLNRHQLRERLQQAMSASDEGGFHLAVLFIDLDGFKQINDRHDHQVGDRLLADVAQRLRGALRQGDQLARVGGDEFVVIAPMGGQHDEPLRLGERLIQCMLPRFRVGALSLSVGASLGISLYPGESQGVDQLLNDADLAMYQAKAAGGNCLRLFQRELRSRTEARLQMLDRLREALKEERLRLHYQVQYTLEEQPRPVGIEALLRWHDGEYGQVPPAQFIALAEEYGLIGAITHWVLERACRDNLALIRSGLLDVPVAVNISGSTFLREDFLALIGESLARSGLPSERLELEITERVAVSNLEEARQIINSLRARGVLVSMDDFGTGYSSLGALKQLPFDRLKIDRSFIAGLPADAVDQAIVRAAVQVAASLGITVVAEGIETAEQLACLRASGCDHGQGYWLARPMPLEPLQALLRARQAAPAKG